mgnify:CR=1 FL=1
MEAQPPKGRTTGIVAYITIVGALIAITMNMEPKHAFARFHIRQAFGIHLLFHAFAILNNLWFNAFGFAGLYLAYFILWIYGFMGALNGKKQEVPLVGSYFQKWFTFIN